MRVGIIVIGNEVLSGKVTDINSTWLMREFHELGVHVHRVSIIPDEIPEIVEEVRKFSQAYDVVFTTGGVGPTHDDVTFAAVAQAFGRDLERSPKLEAIIREQIPSEGSSGYLRMANLPTGTDLIFTPGLPFPVTKVANVYVMPGEPTVMKKKFMAIKETFRQPPFFRKSIYLRVDEGQIADPLDVLQFRFSAVEIGSYPVYDNPDYKVQVTFRSKSQEAVQEAFDAFATEFPPEALWKTE